MRFRFFNHVSVFFFIFLFPFAQYLVIDPATLQNEVG